MSTAAVLGERFEEGLAQDFLRRDVDEPT